MKHKIAHPCYSAKEHNRKRRRHFPVAPRCNIKCGYCAKGIEEHFHISRPGLTRKVMTPEEAFQELKKDFQNGIQYVAGVAGPGDPLFCEETFRFFELTHKEFPSAWLCACTNGLLLYDKARELHRLGVRTVTVTVNALSPKVLEKIVSDVFYNGKKYGGAEGAGLLLENQIKGIELARALGITLKVNTILIPGMNDFEIEKIARFCKNTGIYIMNINSLIPAGNFRKLRAPSCRELQDARTEAEKHIKQFRHCMQCRADADGIPGKKENTEDFYNATNSDLR